MASPAGRLLRIVAGIALVYIGLVTMGGTGGWVVAIVGLVPLLAGLFDFCVLAPIIGAPFKGPDIRSAG
jgi:hypothetical protein